MRWFNPKIKNFQIAGTAPEPGSIKVFEGEDQYKQAIPSRNEKYVIYEKGFIYEPSKDGYIKFRNNIDKSKAFMMDIFVGDEIRTEDALVDYLQQWKKARPQDWL